MRDIMRSIYESHSTFTDFNADESGSLRLHQIGRMVGSGKRVLDIGCSLGNVSAHIASLGNTVVGIDIAPSYIKACRDKGIECYSCNIETDDLPDIGQFATIVMTEFFEHLIDPLRVLEKIRKLIVPGGELIVSTINCAFIRYRFELGRGRLPEFGEDRSLNHPPRLYNLHHKSLFTIPTFIETLRAGGYDVIDLEPVSTAPSGYWRTPGLSEIRTVLQNHSPRLFASDIIARAKPVYAR
jgi:SAM-dependent methyltransferase